MTSMIISIIISVVHAFKRSKGFQMASTIISVVHAFKIPKGFQITCMIACMMASTIVSSGA